MTRRTQRLTVSKAVTLSALGYGHDVVGVVGVVHVPAVSTRPGVPSQHGLPPRAVRLVAVATGRCVGPGRVVTPASCRQSGRPVRWYASGHAQLLRATNPEVPVLFVVPLTIFRNGRAKTASGKL